MSGWCLFSVFWSSRYISCSCKSTPNVTQTIELIWHIYPVCSHAIIVFVLEKWNISSYTFLTLPDRNTLGWSLCKTLNYSSANTRCGWLRRWFQLHAAHCLGCWCKYSNTQNHSVARPVRSLVWKLSMKVCSEHLNTSTIRLGHYITIPRNCLSIVKLGQVLALFSWLVRLS